MAEKIPQFILYEDDDECEDLVEGATMKTVYATDPIKYYTLKPGEVLVYGGAYGPNGRPPEAEEKRLREKREAEDREWFRLFQLFLANRQPGSQSG